MYAIVSTGGKQHKVSEGQLIDVEQLSGKEGQSVELDPILLVADGDRVITGHPIVDGAKVKASIMGHGKSPKVTVFKYKSKIRYRRKKGHRQLYTRLKIDQIMMNQE